MPDWTSSSSFLAAVIWRKSKYQTPYWIRQGRIRPAATQARICSRVTFPVGLGAEGGEEFVFGDDAHSAVLVADKLACRSQHRRQDTLAGDGPVLLADHDRRGPPADDPSIARSVGFQEIDELLAAHRRQASAERD
jgi:hypothetical protein